MSKVGPTMPLEDLEGRVAAWLDIRARRRVP